MALNKKEELPFEIETEQTNAEQISFDDIDFETEVLTDEELEEQNSVTKYYTISGKEQQYEPEWEKYNVRELDVGATMEGRPEITVFENKDKTYNALRLRVLDDGEILDCYINFPKKDFPYVRNINTGFDFYRNCFDFIFSVLKLRDERNVVKNGEEVNKFAKMNLEMLAKYVDQHERVGIQVTEGNADSEYNSWIIYKLE